MTDTTLATVADDQAQIAQSAVQGTSVAEELERAEAHVRALRKELENEQKSKRAKAIADVRELMKEHNLTLSDLGHRKEGGKDKDAVAARTDDRRNQVVAKYQDPDTGKTWTGRGKSPVWLSAQLAEGKSKSDFLIVPATPAAAVAPAAAEADQVAA